MRTPTERQLELGLLLWERTKDDIPTGHRFWDPPGADRAYGVECVLVDMAEVEAMIRQERAEGLVCIDDAVHGKRHEMRYAA